MSFIFPSFWRKRSEPPATTTIVTRNRHPSREGTKDIPKEKRHPRPSKDKESLEQPTPTVTIPLPPPLSSSNIPATNQELLNATFGNIQEIPPPQQHSPSAPPGHHVQFDPRSSTPFNANHNNSTTSTLSANKIPVHELLRMLRHYDGSSDPKEFLAQFNHDVFVMGQETTTFALNNFDRVLDKEALSWWQALLPSVLRNLERNGDPDNIWENVVLDFFEFFNQKSRRGLYKQKNRELKLKKGDDPTSYVSSKLLICKNINPNMAASEKVEKLIAGIPFDWQQNLALHEIKDHTQFLSKLRAVTDSYTRNQTTSSMITLNPNAPSPTPVKAKDEIGPQLQALQAQIEKLISQPQSTPFRNSRNENQPYVPKPAFGEYEIDRSTIVCSYCKKVGHHISECRAPGCRYSKATVRDPPTPRPAPRTPAYQPPPPVQPAQYAIPAYNPPPVIQPIQYSSPAYQPAPIFYQHPAPAMQQLYYSPAPGQFVPVLQQAPAIQAPATPTPTPTVSEN